MPIIILTAHGSIESAVEATKRGAFNYLNKPFDPQELLLQTERAMEHQRLASEVRKLEGLLKERYDFKNIIARSEKMQRVLDLVSRIARTDSTIYISGESGTGKEVIAKAIHLASERRDKPFVAINCAAIPEPLLESELFGYEKGAFTDAKKSHGGLFAQSHQGTILLDEIGDMSLSVQAKLLRVLQEKKFYPLGSEKPVDVDVRVIVATNKDLETEVKNGSFREDLFYRIHVVPISLPPLRERKEEIPPLAEHFLKEISQRMKKEIKGISAMAMQKLMLYDWPGNVRELENTIEHAVAVTQHDVISEEIILPTKDLLAEPLKPFKEAVEEFKRGYVVRLLEFTKGNVSKAAELAGKYRADFYNLVKKHNLKPEDFKNDKEK
jgi:two-component system response regulator GlrR